MLTFLIGGGVLVVMFAALMWLASKGYAIQSRGLQRGRRTAPLTDASVRLAEVSGLAALWCLRIGLAMLALGAVVGLVSAIA